MQHSFEYYPERDEDACAIEALLDRAFGHDRHNKTSYRFRVGIAPLRDLALTGWLDGRLVGTVRFWPVVIDRRWPALLLGPLAVDPEMRGRGCGIHLMRQSLANARARGHERVILVGDLPYYSRVGFRQVPEGTLTLPGPFDPARLLMLELVPGAMAGIRGPVGRADSRDSAAFAVPGGAEEPQQYCEGKQR